MKQLILVISAMLFFLFCGCSISTNADLYKNTYNPGEDFQYFQMSEMSGVPHVQETKDGCFAYHNGFIHSFQRSSGFIVPVCSKPNCLHDLETDPDKISECNAFIGEPTQESTKALMLYQDSLYMFSSDPENGSLHLMKITQDGSSKNVVISLQDMNVNLSLIHRGYLYFHGESFSLVDTGVQHEIGIWRVNLTKRRPHMESVYQVPSGIKDYGYGFLQAYGRYVYFDQSYTEDGEGKTELLAYDIVNSSVKVVDIPAPRCTFLDGKLYYHPYGTDDTTMLTDIYRADLDGTNQETVLSGVKRGYYVISDGQYIYTNNAYYTSFLQEEPTKMFAIYDNDMNLIDECKVPETDVSFLGPPVGGKNCQYTVFDDPDTGEWGVLVWDKSKIGSYHGAAYEQERIVYGVK